MYSLGYQCVTNIDINADLVATMSNRFSNMNEMQFAVVDACATNIPPKSFGLVFDKAFLDYLLASSQPARAESYLGEVSRLLDTNGLAIFISHGVPERRLALLARCFQVPPSLIKVTTLPKPNVPGMDLGAAKDYYVYKVTKI